MAITPRTAEEASKYILESVEEWKNTNQDKKIISLSNWAEGWRSNAGGHTTRIRELKKNIRALTLVIKRKRVMYLEMPAEDPIVLELEAHQNAYNDLVAQYGEPKISKKKQKIKIAIEPEIK